MQQKVLVITVPQQRANAPLRPLHLPGPAQQSLHTRLKLTELKGFGQVVVGAHVQTQHPVGHAGTRGQNHHRHRIGPLAQRLQHRQTIAPRQIQVQQDQLKPVARLQLGVSRLAVSRKSHLQTQLAQSGAQPERELGRVFYQ